MTIARAALLAIALSGVAATAGGQVPALIPLHGVLSAADGALVDGEVQVVFALYDVAEGGEPLYRETRTLALVDGRFSLALGENGVLDPALFADHTALFLGVRVEDDEEAEPRMQLGSVPFAAAADFAHEAAALQGVGGAEQLQRRIVGSCPDGEAMVAVAADGTVRCQPLLSSPGQVGPVGPAGPAGPKGDPGESGPIASFDCEGQAVSALDDQGRATCVPLASVNVNAGPGLVLGGCEGDTCELSVGPDAIGMAQVSLPMATDRWFFSPLNLGIHFYYGTGAVAFMPETDGKCMIVASIEVNDTSAYGSGHLILRAEYLEDDVRGPDWSLLSFASPTSGVHAGSAVTHYVVSVSAGKAYKFGCTIDATGSWVGKGVWCHVSRFCQ